MGRSIPPVREDLLIRTAIFRGIEAPTSLIHVSPAASFVTSFTAAFVRYFILIFFRAISVREYGRVQKNSSDNR